MSGATASGVESSAVELLEGLIDHLRAGGGDPEAFLAAHPTHARTLRELLPAARVLAELSRSGESDGSFPALAAGPALGVLGDFRLVREVGRGGMGVVYEAEQVSLRRRVALKVLPFAAALDPRHLQRFKNEALAAASLKHDHVVQVYAVGCERGVHFIAMEFVDGRTVADLIRDLRPDAGSETTEDYRPAGSDAPTRPVAGPSTHRTGPKDRDHYRRAAGLVAQAADALEYAHSLGVVHRDVKPANLLLDAAGRVSVADFGLARVGTDAGLTGTGDVLGTLRYMAPEQAMARHGLVDHRADVYGLGAVLYELLTLHPAVGPGDRAEVLRKVMFEEPTTPRKLDRSIPAELETVALKCLAKNPADRYATAGELADDLRRWLEDKAIKARPPSPAQRAARWARRHRAAVRTAVAVLAILAAGSAVSGLLVLREKARTEERFQLAREAVDDMYTGVAREWLEDEPRLTHVQEQFLTKALHFYDRMGTDRGGDPATRTAAAAAHLRAGRVQAKLGRHAAAEAAYREAIARAAALAAAGHGGPDARKVLASAHYCLGDVLGKMSRAEEAEWEVRRALDLWTGLAAESSESPETWRDLAGCHTRLGSFHAAPNAGRRAEAEGCYRQALAIHERLVAAAPDEPAGRSDLAGSLHNLASLRRWDDPAEEADRLLERAIGHQRAAVAADPRRVRYRLLLTNHYRLRGFVLSRLQKYAEAEQATAAAADLTRRLVDDFPDVPDYREQLADLHGSHGDALRLAGRLPDAEQAYRRSRDVARSLAGQFPDVPRYQSLLANVQRLWADAVRERHAGQGPNHPGAAEAEQAFRETVAILQGLADRSPGDPEHRHYLGSTRHNLAMLLAERGQSAEARELLQQAVRDQRAAVEARPGRPDYRRDLRNHYYALARDQGRAAGQLARGGRLAEAEAVYREIRDRYERLTTEFPDQPDLVSDLGEFLNNWSALLPPGQSDQARARLEEAVRLQESAVRADPRAPAYRARLRDHSTNLAARLTRLGLPRDAQAAYRRAAELARGLADEFPGEPAHRQSLAEILTRAARHGVRPDVGGRGALPEAERLLREAVGVREKLAEEFPARAPYQEQFVAALDELALFLGKAAGRIPESEAVMRRNLAVVERLAAAHPAEARYQSELGGKLSNLAIPLQLRGEPAEAQALLERAVRHQRAALATDPENKTYRQYLSNHLVLLAEGHEELGRFAAARDAYRGAMEASPEDVTARVGLAWLLATCPDPKLRDAALAAELAKRVTEQVADHAVAWQTLGMARYRMGQWQEAVAALERARVLQTDGFAALGLAMARWQLGEKEPARKLYVEGVQWAGGSDAGDLSKARLADLRRLRAEAASLLGVQPQAPPPRPVAPK